MAQTLFESEIRAQPEALARLIERGRAATDAFAAEVRAFAPQFAIIAARGTSDNAARYAKYLLGAHNGLAVGLAAPSLFTLYDAPPRLTGALAVGISQSGESPDIVAVIAEARRQGALTLAITNAPASPLSRAAAHTIVLHAGEERAVAATKTYTTELMAIAMLSTSIANDAAHWSEIEATPERVEMCVALRDAVLPAASRYGQAPAYAVLGRGFNHATAFEVALKIKETSYVIAEPHSFADFRHGPAAMLDVGFPVLLVAPRGKAGSVAELLDLLEARGAEVIAISNDPAVLARARTPLAMPDVPEWLSPIVAVVPGQWFALALALERGCDPDRPRGLSKVTHTR